MSDFQMNSQKSGFPTRNSQLISSNSTWRLCARRGALALAVAAALPSITLADDEGLQEIVVTAQKRQEKLQDVPISISVLGGENLDKSTFLGVSEALSSVPGVTTTQSLQGGGTQVEV